jgi:ubiquitin C-terminal hydrolase
MFVLHSGTAESGHYVAYVRDTEEIWHLIDDERVKQVSTKETLEAVKLSSICIYKQE